MTADPSRSVRRLTVGLLVAYGLLFIRTNQLLLAPEPETTASQTFQRREAERDFEAPRGTIRSADGVVLAQSVPTPGERFERRREYPTGPLFAHVTGYLSFGLGSDGLERAYNDELAGRTLAQRVRSFSDLLADRRRTADLTLTIDSRVQRAAADALGERRGAVVALDPRTGAVLALWSYPSYDPNPIASFDFETASAAKAAADAEPDRASRSRAFRERFFPGSTFKVVTAAIGLETGTVTRDEPVYPVRDAYVPPQTTRPLRNFGGSACGGDLFEILRVSCNTAFAEMGVQIGADAMASGARAFGFGDVPPIDLPGAVPSRFPPASFFEDNIPLLAQSAIGQNEVQATPLQMALVAAAVANRGVIMAPHVVAEAVDVTGRVIHTARPREWRRPVSEATAAVLAEAMVGVVTGGTARNMAVPGLEVGGKTGTAQLGTDPPSSHAWIIGFAGPPGEPRIAVAVLVEGQPGVSEQTGGTVAAPIARAVIEAALGT